MLVIGDVFMGSMKHIFNNFKGVIFVEEMNRVYEVAIIGTGNRGANRYGRLMKADPEKFKIVALCDLNPARLEHWGKEFNVPEENRFLDENEFFSKKRADALVIATQDGDHYGHILKAFKAGYDILVEKPLTASRKECEDILAAQKASGKQAMVCHVLRYAPAFLKAAEIINSGAIGQLVAINALERVEYWHQTHSYVRGNWRSSKETTPMILAKCCHDLDLLQYYAKSSCESISSIGELTHFKAENAPQGAAKRCTECKYMETCPASAKRMYIDRWHAANTPTDTFPYTVLVIPPVTEEKLWNAIKTGPYGRCVYACDNDVVDHEFTQMTFTNGVKASLFMTAFTHTGGRRYNFHGTLGELILDEAEGDSLALKVFGMPVEMIDVKHGDDQGYSHGGGDYFIIQNFYKMLAGQKVAETSLTASIESHLMGIAAEESRIQQGKLLKVHK